METNKQKIIKILHGKATSYKDCEVLADDILYMLFPEPPPDGLCLMCGKVHAEK